jgi:hypothetical protein
MRVETVAASIRFREALTIAAAFREAAGASWEKTGRVIPNRTKKADTVRFILTPIPGGGTAAYVKSDMNTKRRRKRRRKRCKAFMIFPCCQV